MFDVKIINKIIHTRKMTTRRGIFFNSRSRSNDTNTIPLSAASSLSPPIEDKSTSTTTNIRPTSPIKKSTESTTEDSSHSSGGSQTSPSKTATSSSSGIVKKKLILKNTKRTLTKTIYNGPRKIFSTSYKANRAQFNHKTFFGGDDTDELDLDNDEKTSTTICRSQPSVEQTITKTSLLVKSKSSDSFRSTATSTTTITENGKTKVICPRDQKKMYTVVPNIRQPTTCEELGETQSYIDDMDYLLAGFQSDKLLSDRCLSAVKFAELCGKPSFRMHLRTESALERVLGLLQDAPTVPSLNLVTAFILYVLSSDTLTSGINPSTLQFMFALINKSPSVIVDDREYDKMKQRIWTLINKSTQDDIFYEHRFHTCDIILETLVNISRNNLKEWLRNEARTLGGLDLMIDAVSSIVQDLSNNDFECYSLSAILIRYRKVCRFVNMLEEFASDNGEQSSSSASSSSSNIDMNRVYIAQYNRYSLFHSLSKLLDLSLGWMQQYTSASSATTTTKDSNMCDTFRDGCKAIMSILVILTNDCEINCDRLTADDRFFANLFRLLVTIERSSISNEDKFDALALTLNLLINLVQNTKNIYKRLMEDNMPGESTTKIYEYLVRLFCEQESLAAKAESQEENDWMMEDGDEEELIHHSSQIPNENGANFNRALQKAAGHMENTFVAAFAGVVLAVVLSRDQTTYASQIRALMPQNKFDTMAFILKKFFVFMHMSHAFTPSGVKILEEIVSMVLSLCG